MDKNFLNRNLFTVILVCALLFSGCANDGVPETWEDQDGLVVRNFVEACQESNSDMSTFKARSYCECVINGVKEAVTFEKFKELDDFIRKHRDDLNSKMISENYGWLNDSSEACS
ncbi:MAG: hypothetical protein VYB02_01335 [Actinomycetota bacterium]|nr:hypothetical protein [Dehalococcoidia bacterium]MEC7908838.1 hypothetical protein [Actinomycetota bacterium]